MWDVWPALRLTGKRRASPGPDRAFRQAGWLRPGQAGVILVGAVRPVHIAATLVDLSGRGYLRIEEADGDEPDWFITKVRPAPVPGRGESLLRYEKTLLRRVLRGGGQVRLSDFSQKTARAAMGKVYTQLGRILGARLSPAGLDEDLPPAEDETMATLRAFCGFLRDLDPAAETDPWTAFGDYLPYAIAFQLMPAWGERFAMLTPPGQSAARPGAWWGFRNDLPMASALAGFTTAVCSHVPPVGHPSHHDGSAAGHAGAFGHHGGHGGHDGHDGHGGHFL
jgi:hypothetical protein